MNYLFLTRLYYTEFTKSIHEVLARRIYIWRIKCFAFNVNRQQDVPVAQVR